LALLEIQWYFLDLLLPESRTDASIQIGICKFVNQKSDMLLFEMSSNMPLFYNANRAMKKHGLAQYSGLKYLLPSSSYRFCFVAKL